MALVQLRRRGAAALLTALLLAVGCGGDDDDSASTTTAGEDETTTTGGDEETTTTGSDGDDGGGTEACRLSAEEMSEVVGFDVDKADSGPSGCTYTATSEDKLAANVSITSIEIGPTDVEAVVDQVAEALGEEVEEVDEGWGDQSFVIDAGGFVELIVFENGTQHVIAFADLSADANVRDTAYAIADAVLG